MSAPDILASKTCRELLKVSHLKAICAARGFPVPRGGKDSLADFVAPRLLEPAGVEGAMASLEQKWLRVLHSVAMAEEPPTLEALAPVLRPRLAAYYLNYRTLFAEVADGLLSRGVAVVEEKGWGSGQKRYQNMRLVLPEALRPALPPFPIPTGPLADRGASGAALPFLRRVLQDATGVPKRGRSAAEDLAGQLSAKIAPKEGRWQAGPGLGALLRKARASWIDSSAWRRDGAHILEHLPEGRGASPTDLRAALVALGHDVVLEELVTFCRAGQAAGLLGAGPKADRFRALSPERALEGDSPLAFAAGAGGITVDLEQTGLGPLLDLAPLCRVATTNKGLLLTPDLARLGRAAPDLEGRPVLTEVLKRSSAFRKVVEHVRSRHGTLLLHEGLSVLRVEDAGLRVLLERQLPDHLRPLGGPWLAVLPAAVPEVEKLVRKQGLAPRRVSA